MSFKDTTNCISSNDRLVDCVLKWKKYSAVFYAKGSESYKSSYKGAITVNVEQNQLTNERTSSMLYSQ